MNAIALAIRQPVTVIVGVILVVMAGALSLHRIPVQLTPNVDSTIITVTTFWEGASPQEIEQNIIDRQEERLLGTSNLRLMTSSSAQGRGTIRLEFHIGTDKAEALREVSDRLREVPDYPENVDEPVVTANDRENRDFIAWIVLGSTDPNFDVRTLQDFAKDRIQPALERVEGIAEVNALGGWERELQVRLDPVRLAQYGITPSRFAQVIRDANQNISAGLVAQGKLDIRLRTVGQYHSTAEIEDTVIADNEAGIVHVRDVADVVQTFKEPTSFVRSSGRPVIAINADREIGSNVMTVMERFKAEIARLNAPGGVLDAESRSLGLNGKLELTQVYDQTVYIKDALGLVQSNIWVGGALATMILLFFLRSIRSVAIIAVAIPISVLGGVVVMVAMGRTVNVVSLAGMAFAVGMVVDDAIVVLENIFRHLEMGKSRVQAALDGTREVWGAVLASTLTTIVAFVPILLVREEAGQLFRDISLAICASMFLSMIVSVTLIPCAGARLLREHDARVARTGVSDAPRGGIPGALGSLLYSMCGSTLVRVGVVAVLTVASVVGTWLMMPPSDYLPQGNRNLVFGVIIPPPGYNMDQLNDMADRIEVTTRPFWEVGHMTDLAAKARAAAELPAVPTFDMVRRMPGVPVVPPPLKDYFLVAFEDILFHGGISADPKRVVDLIPLFMHATRPDVLPGVIAFPFQVPLFQLGGSTGSAIKLQLAGPDLDEVVRCAKNLGGILFGDEDFDSVQPDPGNFALPAPEVQVRPNLVRLSELGLSTRDVGLAVQAAGDGAIIDEYQLAGEAIDLKVIATDATGKRRSGALEDIPIATPAGQVVMLGSIAEIRPVGAAQQIARYGRQRAVSFQVTPSPVVPLEQAMNKLDGIIAGMREAGQIPPAIVTSMAGSASKLQEVRRALLGDGTLLGTANSSMVLALLVVYLVMCVVFQSFMRPLVIMFTVPLATVGGFAALAAVRFWSLHARYMPIQSLDVLTMLGFVLLIGVVVKNAILIVHQSVNFMTAGADPGNPASEPLPPRRAIAEAVRTRIRPIFMTTLTSVLGMAPLVLMPGSGSELYRGLGSVVCGGLIVSTIFTIFLTPLLLSLATDFGQAMRGQRKAPPPRRHPQSHPAGRPAAGVPASAARSSDA